ncbi:uncharacterized protein [Drosophila pseudoobscura]|uniref:Uncharacterized protein isoform X1 n=1 Tax=Drosophila pseudoobscura pseudoobscura TaxID=46245 RepID=A0A6I8V9Q2_DROPS|nr:uncharacterized protein LOC6903010 isoform X1 [Drosophila pseudoobscura]
MGYPGSDYHMFWEFSLTTWNGLTTALDGNLQVIFLYMLAVGFMELIYNYKQIYLLLTMEDISEVSWPQTNWFTLSDRMLHHCWIASSLAMVALWNYLLYAFLWVKPELLYRWQVMYGTTIIADVLCLARARWAIRFGVGIAYLLPLWHIFCVNSLRTYTEQQAINNDSTYFYTRLFHIPSFLLQLVR